YFRRFTSYKSFLLFFNIFTVPYSCKTRRAYKSTSAISTISVFGVASALIPLFGKAKSDGVNTADCEYWISILFTRGRLPTQPAIATSHSFSIALAWAHVRTRK